jgi:nucleotidyltransferase/DNA polymerase involved in DNA repair
MGPGFVQDLAVGKFHGIGPATRAKMNGLGIFTGMDMRNQTLEFMAANFGKAGTYYYWISRGIDERPVRANRIRKSVGTPSPASRRWKAPRATHGRSLRDDLQSNPLPDARTALSRIDHWIEHPHSRLGYRPSHASLQQAACPV